MTGFAFAYAVVRVCGGQPRKNPGAPFCGSGTTGIAANLLERGFVGIEREREYVEMSQRRRLEIDNPQTAESYRTRIKDIDFVERCEVMV